MKDLNYRIPDEENDGKPKTPPPKPPGGTE
jgi:hypothetical protein